MDHTLRTLQSLLRRNGYGGQADALERVRTARQRGDRKAFESQATGLSIWGGAGSVADADIRYGSPQSPAEAKADVPEFYRGMIALAEELEREGLATPRIRQVASTFRGWLAQGV